jgi:hypothetical protein
LVVHITCIIERGKIARPRAHFAKLERVVLAGLAVDLIFKALGLVRTARNAKVVEASVHLNYTTVLNIVFLGLAAVLLFRFLHTGGLAMLRAMNKPVGEHAHRRLAA